MKLVGRIRREGWVGSEEVIEGGGVPVDLWGRQSAKGGVDLSRCSGRAGEDGDQGVQRTPDVTLKGRVRSADHVHESLELGVSGRRLKDSSRGGVRLDLIGDLESVFGYEASSAVR